MVATPEPGVATTVFSALAGRRTHRLIPTAYLSRLTARPLPAVDDLALNGLGLSADTGRSPTLVS